MNLKQHLWSWLRAVIVSDSKHAMRLSLCLFSGFVVIFGIPLSVANARLNIERPIGDELVRLFHEVKGNIDPAEADVVIFIGTIQLGRAQAAQDQEVAKSVWVVCDHVRSNSNGSWKVGCDCPNPTNIGKSYVITAISPTGKRNYRRGQRLSNEEFLDIQGQRSDSVWVTSVMLSADECWQCILEYGVPLLLGIGLVLFRVLFPEAAKKVWQLLKSVRDLRRAWESIIKGG